jgi:hypothetical protein
MDRLSKMRVSVCGNRPLLSGATAQLGCGPSTIAVMLGFKSLELVLSLPLRHASVYPPSGWRMV